MRKTVTAIGIVLLFAVGLMFLGMFIDIQIILKYDYTPISFTFTFLIGGLLVGILLARRILNRRESRKREEAVDNAVKILEPIQTSPRGTAGALVRKDRDRH